MRNEDRVASRRTDGTGMEGETKRENDGKKREAHRVKIKHEVVTKKIEKRGMRKRWNSMKN